MKTDSPPCVLCGKPSVERISVLTPTLEDKARPLAPVCRKDRDLVIAELDGIGWCPQCRAHGRRFTSCQKHQKVYS